MSADGGGTGRAVARTVSDALAYAVVVAAVAVVVSFVAGIAIGGSVVGAKLALFLVGWLLVGIATVRLWPNSPRQATKEGDAGRGSGTAFSTDDTRVESVVDDLPPLRWMESPSRQLSPPTKLFLAGVLVLVVSFLLEVVFAVE